LKNQWVREGRVAEVCRVDPDCDFNGARLLTLPLVTEVCRVDPDCDIHLSFHITSDTKQIRLNPYLGFLHSRNDRYESLVADIQEFFRADVDSFIIKIINLKIIEKEDFYETKKMVRLNYNGGSKFINAIEGEFNRKNKYGESLSNNIYMKILNIKNWVLDKENLMF